MDRRGASTGGMLAGDHRLTELKKEGKSVMSENIIEIANLSKYYGKHKGVEDVTFNVAKGEIFGFIGPNGAGKTTTIRSLLALIRPTSGSITVFGKDSVREAQEVAARMGYLPSEAYYYEKMKVKELLKYAADLYRKDCAVRTAELAERLKLDLNRKITDLSYGNKKKVGIVAALLHEPELLILDEPTSGLDPLIKETFFDILREENEKGTTILFSSHVLSEVQRICGRVAFLKEGRVIMIHPIHELRKVGYKKIALSSEDAIPESYFDMGGIADYQQSGSEISFMYQGEIVPLLKKLSGLSLEDVYVEEPSLEEIFLHYYR